MTREKIVAPTGRSATSAARRRERTSPQAAPRDARDRAPDSSGAHDARMAAVAPNVRRNAGIGDGERIGDDEQAGDERERVERRTAQIDRAAEQSR